MDVMDDGCSEDNVRESAASRLAKIDFLTYSFINGKIVSFRIPPAFLDCGSPESFFRERP